ncbi:MAG: biotin transporter BioY [Huintestinicola sp.]
MDRKNTQSIRNKKTYSLTVIALMSAVTCVLAPLSIPIGPVPISLTNLVIFLSLYILDWKKGTISYLIYILIGFVGLPVFSGFTGGVGKLAGPTGGYIIGFIPMAIIAGLAIDKFHKRWIHLAGMIIGTVICYAVGTAWFCYQSGTALTAALSICVFPFIPGDLMKMIIVILFAPTIREKLDMTKSNI